MYNKISPFLWIFLWFSCFDKLIRNNFNDICRKYPAINMCTCVPVIFLTTGFHFLEMRIVTVLKWHIHDYITDDVYVTVQCSNHILLPCWRMLNTRYDPLVSRHLSLCLTHWFFFQLHMAAANGYLELCKFLLRHDLHPNIKDCDGWTALHAAACWCQVCDLIWSVTTLKSPTFQ